MPFTLCDPTLEWLVCLLACSSCSEPLPHRRSNSSRSVDSIVAPTYLLVQCMPRNMIPQPGSERARPTEEKGMAIQLAASLRLLGSRTAACLRQTLVRRTEIFETRQTDGPSPAGSLVTARDDRSRRHLWGRRRRHVSRLRGLSCASRAVTGKGRGGRVAYHRCFRVAATPRTDDGPRSLAIWPYLANWRTSRANWACSHATLKFEGERLDEHAQARVSALVLTRGVACPASFYRVRKSQDRRGGPLGLLSAAVGPSRLR